jgi:hypothetical protein
VDQRRWRVLRRLGGGAVTTAGLVTFPGVGSVLGDVGDAIGDNPTSAAAVALGLLLLVSGYWSSILRALGIRTANTVHRDVREHLDVAGYMVRQDTAPPNFEYTIRNSTDTVEFQLRRIAGDSERIQVVGTVGFTPDEMLVMADAAPSDIRELLLRAQVALAPLSISSALHGGMDPQKLHLLIVAHVLVDNLTNDSLSETINTVRKGVSIVSWMFSDAAERRVEHEQLMAEIDARHGVKDGDDS